LGPNKLELISEKLEKIREDFKRFSKSTEKTTVRAVTEQESSEADGEHGSSLTFADLNPDNQVHF